MTPSNYLQTHFSGTKVFRRDWYLVVKSQLPSGWQQSTRRLDQGRQNYVETMSEKRRQAGLSCSCLEEAKSSGLRPGIFCSSWEDKVLRCEPTEWGGSLVLRSRQRGSEGGASVFLSCPNSDHQGLEHMWKTSSDCSQQPRPGSVCPCDIQWPPNVEERRLDKACLADRMGPGTIPGTYQPPSSLWIKQTNSWGPFNTTGWS